MSMTPKEAHDKGLIVLGHLSRVLKDNPKLREIAEATLDRDGNGHTPDVDHTLRQLGRIVDLIGLSGFKQGNW